MASIPQYESFHQYPINDEVVDSYEGSDARAVEDFFTVLGSEADFSHRVHIEEANESEDQEDFVRSIVERCVDEAADFECYVLSYEVPGFEENGTEIYGYVDGNGDVERLYFDAALPNESPEEINEVAENVFSLL